MFCCLFKDDLKIKKLMVSTGIIQSNLYSKTLAAFSKRKSSGLTFHKWGRVRGTGSVATGGGEGLRAITSPTLGIGGYHLNV